jgi:3-carboxy-cis,cis-muconate cycloisomerase
VPGKHNPIDAVRALAAADACAGVAAIAAGAHPHEFERAAGAWQVEWFAVPLALQTGGAALAAVGEAAASAQLDRGRAAANVGDAVVPADAAARVMIQRVLAECERVLGRSG